MKKSLSVILSAALTAGVLTAAVSAEELSAEVYVTIADENGKLALANEKIEVKDIDGNGALTIDDALYCAHEAKFDGGAEAGYKSADSDYGRYLEKLWGVENGGSYGYYLNNASTMSLDDKIISGDYVNAFVYTDLTAWSDTYCYFDTASVSAEVNEPISLTLTAAGYDENYAPVTFPVANAVITANGVETEFVTDNEGKVEIALDGPEYYVISAVSSEKVLVPPVCLAEIYDTVVEDDNTTDEVIEGTTSDVSAETDEKGSPDTGVADAAVFGGLALVCALGVICSKKR